MAYSLQPIVPAMRAGLFSTPMFHGIEAASQTWYTGAILVNSSGSLAEATEGEDTSFANNIVGVAAFPASGVTNTDVLYYPAIGSVIFEGSVEDFDAPGTATAIIAQTSLFAYYNLANIDTGAETDVWFIDATSTTSSVVMPIGFPLQPSSTSNFASVINGRVWFVFAPQATVWGKST